MDGLAIAAALGEMRRELEGGWIRSIYQPTRSLFVLRVFAGAKQTILISPRDASMHLTNLDIANPESPSTFVMQLRKHLKGGRIVSIVQRGWDRIVA
ncbi:NFACT family protein, partial [Candidatus Bipolaricaulota bacterium]|nr:NFACT family protein [Candidatus Bipolaricaulota bacterium]